MFICQDCHVECQYCRSHDFKDSYGRCEWCGENKSCADCNHNCRVPVEPSIRQPIDSVTISVTQAEKRLLTESLAFFQANGWLLSADDKNELRLLRKKLITNE